MFVPYSCGELPKLESPECIPDHLEALRDGLEVGKILCDVSSAEVARELSTVALTNFGLEVTEEEYRSVYKSRWLQFMDKVADMQWGPIPGKAKEEDAPLHVDSAPHHPFRVRFHYTEAGEGLARVFETRPEYMNYATLTSEYGGAILKHQRKYEKGRVDDRALDPEGYEVPLIPGTLLIFRVGGPATAHIFRTTKPRKGIMISGEAA